MREDAEGCCGQKDDSEPEEPSDAQVCATEALATSAQQGGCQVDRVSCHASKCNSQDSALPGALRGYIGVWQGLT